MRRGLKIAALLAGALAVLLIAAAATGYAWLQSQGGRSWIEARLSTATGGQVLVDGLSGGLPFEPQARRLTLSDAEGPWLIAEGVRISLRPAALLGRRVDVEIAAADRMTVFRLPHSSSRENPESGAPQLPELPVSIEIRHLSLPDIVLDRAVIGQAARLALSGSGALRERAAELALTARRLDAEGDAHADLDYDGAHLRLNLDVNDPGGLAARSLGAQRDLPFEVRAIGDGPLQDWRGTLEARFADASSRLEVESSGAQVTLAGSLDPRPLLEPRLAMLLPEPVQVEGAFEIGKAKVLKHVAVSSGATKARFDGALRMDDITGSGTARLELPDASVLEPLIGRAVEGAVEADAKIITTAEGQTADINLTARALAAEGFSADTISLQATARRGSVADAFDVEGVLTGAGIAREAEGDAPPLPADLSLAFSGSIFPQAQRVDVERLSLTGEGAEIAFAGQAGLDGLLDGRFKINAPQIAPFTQLAGLPWSGALTMEARLRSTPGSGRTQFDIDGLWREPVTMIPVLDAALGKETSLSASGSADFEGSVELTRGALVAGALDLSLSGRLAQSSEIGARFDLALSDLVPLGTAIGQPLAGAARLAGTIEGELARPKITVEASSPNLTFADTDLRALAMSGEFETLLTPLQGQGKATVSATVAGVPASLASSLVLREDVLSFSDAVFRSNGAQAGGNLSVALDGGAIEGAIDLTARDLSPWSKLAGIALAGAAEGRVVLKRNGGATAKLRASDLRVAETEVAQLSADADLTRWRSDPAGRIDLRAERIAAGAARIDKASVRIEPGRNGHAVTMTASGTAAAPFSLETRGAYEPKGKRLRVETLSGRFADKPVRLREATAISFGSGLAVAPFDLAWGEGRIAGALNFDRKLSGSIDATALPLHDLAQLAGREDVTGTLRARLSLSGTHTDPQAKLSATVAGLAMSSAPKGTPSGELALTGDLTRERLAWTAKLSSGAALAVTGSGALPAAWSKPPFGIALDPAGPVRARIEGAGELAPLILLFGIGEDRASGGYAVDLSIGGRLNQPAVTGTAKIENGRYENFASGAILQNIALDARGDRDRLTLRLTAEDGEGGRIEGDGALHLSGMALAAVDAQARLAQFRALRRDDVRAQTTGALALSGPLDAMTLRGEVTLERMQVVLPESSRLSAPKLDVIEVNAPTSEERVIRSAEPAATGQAPALEIGLAIKATLPRVDVTGRGLKSEWQGAVTLGGTTAAPQISGELKLRRGSFAVLGKTFSLVEGQIVFDGGADFDPSLRVIAERQVRDAVARATLTGSLSSPLLEFSARPELPVDEVLARLLFDKSAGQVGAAEALQLAQAAAALSGGGASPGVLEEIGRKFGLDRIDVSTVETVDKKGEASEAAALSLGKDLGEDVRVGVEQGIEPGTGSVSVEVDLGKNLSVESKVGAQGRSGVGLKWEYDY